MSVGQPKPRDPEDDRRRTDLPRPVRRRRPRTVAAAAPIAPVAAVAPLVVLTPLARMLAELADTSTTAELAAIHAESTVDHASLLLLAQTARALHGLLVTIGESGPSWDEGERLARMRRWLEHRAAHDETAVRSAELCARAAAVFAS